MYILYFIQSIVSGLCNSVIAHPYIYMYIFLFHSYTYIGVYEVVVVELSDYLLDIAALSELEAQAFRNNIC